MTEMGEDFKEDINVQNDSESYKSENPDDKERIEKEFIPHFFPTYRIKRKLYPIPIIIVVFCAGLLAYLAYIIAGVRIDGGYIPGGNDPLIGLMNGLIFTATAVISAFIMIYFAKKKGIEVLKYIFGISFGFLSFFLTIFFGEIILWIFLFEDARAFTVSDTILMFESAMLTIIIVYLYFTSESIKTKNFIVIYIGLLTGAMMGLIMPLWSTLAILIGISCWDIFAVLYKRGPIKEMMDLASRTKGMGEREKYSAKLL